MKLLAVDTATEACSVALMLGDKTDHIFELCPQQQSQRILPMVDEILTRNHTKISELDGLVYGRGPGSFTGVRIASSTIQGLALGADLQVAEVSTLAAMAQENLEVYGQTDTLALIDARMSEVYCARYVASELGLVELYKADDKSDDKLLLKEHVLRPELVQQYLGNQHKEMDKAAFVGTGFETYSEQLGQKLQSIEVKVKYPNARYMLAIARSQFEKGLAVPPEQVKPIYVRDEVTWKKLPGRE
ncbi:tRNA (adenosine(37)-N6)-threonylcarbamoyltransferase complex dimerization subunit type 1 TsaB [Ningiella sp. W23]|uniref:tRNA (adenosine(37)-N6)-threonylcarbamoyltransferase complex dimerization subunit type 1 TsaB n=1 Tax=Ningiella sp. W23 TaxID=3023715 RepID=UPI003758117A